MWQSATFMQCPQRPEEVVRSPSAELRDCYESPCGHWELNQSSLQEQYVLLTTNPLYSPEEILCFKLLSLKAAS